MDTTKVPPFAELCERFNYKPTGKLLRNEEAATVLRMKPGALDQLRFKGGGPQYSKPSRLVLYAEPDVLAYLYKGLRTSTSDTRDNVAA